MKYLWVEDFNKGYDNELEKIWKDYYCLNDKELIIKTNLEDAIEYIQNDLTRFDVVLLDINFPISISRNSDIDIYNKYLSNIITKDFFEKNKKTGAGILLFLYLILKMRFPKERIAFLSANIDNIPDDIKEALKYIDVDDINKITEEAYNEYDALVADLNEDYEGKFRFKSKAQIKEFNTEELKKYVYDIKQQCESFSNINVEENEDSYSNKVKYNKAELAFKEVGFELSEAFPKPDMNQQGHDEKFADFILKIEKEYSKLRRYIIEMSIIIDLNDGSIIYNRYNNKKNFDDEFLIIKYRNLLDNIKLIPFIIDTGDKEKDRNIERHIYYRVINQITHDWESSKKPIYFLPDKKVFTLCNNYKDCILKDFGYKDKNRNCIDDNDNCDYIMVNGKCKADKCIFSKDFKFTSKYKNDLCKNEHFCKYQYTIEDFTYQSVLKMVRNWLAHNKLQENNIDVGLAAFIFGIGMRGLFDIENLNHEKKEEYLKWENKLIDLISECYNKNKEDYKIDKNSIINIISKSCFDFYDTAKDLNDFAYSPNIGSMIHLIGGEKSNLHCNGEYILRLFAHCLFPVKIEPVFKEEDEGKYEFKLEVNTDFLEKEDAIELKYFKAIYKACLV